MPAAVPACKAVAAAAAGPAAAAAGQAAAAAAAARHIFLALADLVQDLLLQVSRVGAESRSASAAWSASDRDGQTVDSRWSRGQRLLHGQEQGSDLLQLLGFHSDPALDPRREAVRAEHHCTARAQRWAGARRRGRGHRRATELLEMGAGVASTEGVAGGGGGGRRAARRADRRP